MRHIYKRPETDAIKIEVCHLMANSAKDQYSIGGSDYQWPKSGEISDDYGDGPGVSGAKGNSQWIEED